MQSDVASTDIKKGRHWQPFTTYPYLFLTFCGVFFRKTRAIASAFGVYVAVYKLDDRHWRHVTIPEARFQHAGITALALGVAWAKYIKQFRDIRVLLQLRPGLTAGVEIATFSERDQLVDDPLQFLCLWQSRFDLFVFN